MSIREEQCNKVCRILDDVLANRPTERDSLIVAVRTAFEALEQEEPKRGIWIPYSNIYKNRNYCSECRYHLVGTPAHEANFCPNCGADMRGEQDGSD